jgi:hypothetical protein
MMDDFRDLTAHQSLDVSAEEQDLRYFVAQDMHLSDPLDGDVVGWLSDAAGGISGAQDWNEGLYQYRMGVEFSDLTELEDGEMTLFDCDEELGIWASR